VGLTHLLRSSLHDGAVDELSDNGLHSLRSNAAAELHWTEFDKKSSDELIRE
jgi:hypothetical protein